MSEQEKNRDLTDENLRGALTSEGRLEQGIISPRYLGHFGQTQARLLGGVAEDLMIQNGVEPEVAKRVRTRFVTLGLGEITSVSEFGYAARVLEERAGLPEGSDHMEAIK